MKPAFEALKSEYRSLWTGMAINASAATKAETAATRIRNFRNRYISIEKSTGVPWFFIGLSHLREASLNFNCYLGNGQPLNQVTTIVPKGRGPFLTFEDGAIDALRLQGLMAIKDWSLERIAYCLEGFNGFGYRSHGVHSPYLWAGTNRYKSGKYVRDGEFDANVVDIQLGCMAVLKCLCDLDSDVNKRLNGGPMTAPVPLPPDIPKPKPPAAPVPKKVQPTPPSWIGAILNLIARIFGKGK